MRTHPIEDWIIYNKGDQPIPPIALQPIVIKPFVHVLDKKSGCRTLGEDTIHTTACTCEETK